MIFDPIKCPDCGNADNEKILAVPREYSPPGMFGQPATARHWWQCGLCKYEWKADAGNKPQQPLIRAHSDPSYSRLGPKKMADRFAERDRRIAAHHD